MSQILAASSLLDPALSVDPNPIAVLIWLSIGIGAVLLGGVAVSVTRRRPATADDVMAEVRESVETGSISRIA